MGKDSAAVQARMQIYRMARERGVGDAILGQLLAELGAEMVAAADRAHAVRLAKLPQRAGPAVVVEVELRRKRRRRT